MKKQAYIMIAMFVLVGSMAVAARAQTSGRTQLKANIPFEFNIGNKSLPAGEYVVRSISDDSSNVVLAIRNQDRRSGAMLQMSTVEGKALDCAKLMFHRYGNQYFFAEAWVDGDAYGLKASKSRAERRTELELARSRPKSESIALRRQ